METITAIEQTDKKRIIARLVGTKLLKNIANFGIKKDECAMISRVGIYYGLTIQAMEDFPPLMTNVRVINVLKLLEASDLMTAVHMLHVTSPQELYYVLHHWLKIYEFPIPEFISKNYTDLHNDKLIEFAERDVGYTLPFKFKIVDIGSGKVHTVVPESWLNRVFDNADTLHSEMDKLEWRENEPPVRWCCTFGMILKSKQLWMTKADASEVTPTYGIFIENINSTNFYSFEKTDYFEWLKKIPSTHMFISNANLIIACNKKDFFNDTPVYKPDIKMSVLVSQLQKCYRRGPVCSKLMTETIKRIRDCKPYNLPEHNFMLVSGSKQLLWRTYISTIEDVSVYTSNDLLSLEIIFSLALICHHDSTIQLNEEFLTKLTYTSLAIQSYDTLWNWRSGSTTQPTDKIEKNNIINSMKFALMYMPKMKGDATMLVKSINYLKKYDIPILIKKTLETYHQLANPVAELQCRYESIDMHCYPNIILLIQSALPKKFVGEITTQHIPKIIWDNISKKSFRHVHSIDKTLSEVINIIQIIQKYLYQTEFNVNKQKQQIPYEKEISEFVNATLYDAKYQTNTKPIPKSIGRLAFLLLFGKKLTMKSNGKFKSAEIIVGGDSDDPLKIKRLSTKSKYEFMEGDEKEIYQKQFFKDVISTFTFIPPQAPTGYNWVFAETTDKVVTNIKLNGNKIEFSVNNKQIPAFDCRELLVRTINLVESSNENKFITQVIKHALYIEQMPEVNDFTINILMRKIWQSRYQVNNVTLFKWYHLKNQCEISSDIWNIIYSRIIAGSIINIGPVDRSGGKTQNSISYQYEGVCMRIMNMLAMLYPLVVKITGDSKYTIQKNMPGYEHLMKSLQNTESVVHANITPKIKTKLWDHQQNAVQKIMEGIKKNKLGHCDASSVGSGKTLTAIATIAKLLKYDVKHGISDGSAGTLVLLPTEKLYKTWEDEINKHTKKINICKQSADGEFDNEITYNSIVITTLGRMRDHPIIHKWLYVIIDECLSVQNSSTLHTEEAWHQVTNSKYGVLLLSASFFRSRFNKLLYMLKMLRTGLPEEMEYLDIILNETLVCNLNEKTRKWITNINHFELSPSVREKYDKIVSSSHSDEDKYIKLNKLLFDECDYIKCFKDIIKKIEKTKNRALIYTRSKSEADEIANTIESVTRYPDKTGKHVVVSYAEGTYGLNDLTIYDTIISRPPDADKLPQMKGRLDRPNQQKEVLQIEYLLFKNTIEEAMIYKLEMAKKFHGHYIMPLADFYKLAVGF